MCPYTDNMETREIRARKMSKHHKKLFEAVKVDAGAQNSSEALAALLDAYDKNNGIIDDTKGF